MDYILQMKHITKIFPGVKALDDVTLEVERGTVHALMGENGAGKSTLMKVLFGMHRPDGGEIFINGKKAEIRSTKEALENGISMIYQELSPMKDLNIAENIFMGRYPTKGKGIVDWKETWKRCQEMFDHWGMPYHPQQSMRTLKMADMQMVEIVKAISFGAKLIIMDEPTSAITEREVQKLFEFIRELKSRGVTIVIITHKLDEVFQIADDITVLRDGQYIGTRKVADITRDQMVTMMVGRELGNMYPPKRNEIGDVLLSVKNLKNGERVKDVSFDLHKGEILGFAGIMGAGRSETMRCVFGLDRAESGEIVLNGKTLKLREPRDGISNDIMMVTENRKDDGLVLCRSILENMMLPSLYRTAHHGILDKKNEYSTAKVMSDKLRVKAPTLETRANSLSGGNQQKVILCKWLLMNPKVLILDEPTRGIDVGAKAEIYSIMQELAEQGIGIILISSDMEEIIGMSDRILVMCEGVVNGELSRAEVTQEKIMELASEVKK